MQYQKLYKDSGASNTTPKTDIAGPNLKKISHLRKRVVHNLCREVKDESISTVRRFAQETFGEVIKKLCKRLVSHNGRETC